MKTLLFSLLVLFSAVTAMADYPWDYRHGPHYPEPVELCPNGEKKYCEARGGDEFTGGCGNSDQEAQREALKYCNKFLPDSNCHIIFCCTNSSEGCT